ncbi:arylamine N-acetyltransferase [Alkalihalophilus lindianensis]|uniref:Arylamine N-acetyltransferase n=1 Tax=Alkalihalophilus lindianensis TaxID=1630542 RepID=A0ABU3X8Q8_9BACI|nr:arylamine N-acetyltransferase [Alkalihalophilus lindianensis]MDV2684017.1 arylamine N-acetyltransferase [Alkalihalophilus lindianensis]
MSNITDSTTKYLDCLNLDLEKPSYNYLEQICHAQLNIFPFENISKLRFFRNHNYNNFEIPSFELFTKNYIEYNFGGTCYTLNSNLMILLREIGFDCHHVMLGEEHMGIIVRIDNERFYVDCGAAAPFFKPVRFENNYENISPFGKDEVYIIPEEPQRNRYKYVRYTNGKQSGKTWHFNSRKVAKVSDFNDVIEKSNKPNAPFMTILRCQLYQTRKQRSVSLVNNKFGIRYSNGETSVETLSSPEEIRAVLSEEFSLPKIPVIEAIEVLKTLNIDIFAQSTN